MSPQDKPYVHLTIDAVDTVVFDPDGRHDSERFDRYPTYETARDAALTSVELMLDAEDYDGDDHREELERMGALLEGAEDFAALEGQTGYLWFINRLKPTHTAAA